MDNASSAALTNCGTHSTPARYATANSTDCLRAARVVRGCTLRSPRQSHVGSACLLCYQHEPRVAAAFRRAQPRLVKAILECVILAGSSRPPYIRDALPMTYDRRTGRLPESADGTSGRSKAMLAYRTARIGMPHENGVDTRWEHVVSARITL